MVSFFSGTTAKPKSLSRNACKLVGLRSPLKALKEGGLHSSTYCYQSNPFLLHSPKLILAFQTSSFSNLFARLSSSGISSYIVSLCSKFACHSFLVSQPFSVSIISLPACARDLLQHIGPCFLLSPVVQPDCVVVLVSYSGFIFFPI